VSVVRLLVVVFVCSVMLSACGREYNATLIESKYANQDSRFVSVDGNRVHYRVEGEGPVVVLIHGTASSLHTWGQWVDQLKTQYRIIRMDLPGFGLTGPDRADRYEVSDDVRFLSGFLEALGVEKVHLVGSSLGGRLAWQYSLVNPEQVRSLTLINALGYPQEKWPPAIEMAQWPVVDTLMENVSPRFMYEIGLKEVYFDKALVNDVLVDRYYELSRYPGNQKAFPKRVKARLDQDHSDIANIFVPTLILWGEEDLYFPVASAHQFKQDIKGSSLRIYPSVGHLPMEEVPIKSARDFQEFVGRNDD
jgi:pimeloyl-ACP methyl ester carboxylesterase